MRKDKQKGYKFSDKYHSKTGITSCFFALSSLLLLIAALIVSTLNHGNATIIVGIGCVASFLGALAGFIIAAISFRSTDTLLKYAWLGMIANAVLWMADAGIIAMGM